ncbi:protein WIR1B-like [Triticum urartu]|uniref:protein WIR1B-like n=1 Tax=Triticum urartu TaxID=4572 RepID=UPI002043617E|nr:protein WIR1B-like [Triticum urartu]
MSSAGRRPTALLQIALLVVVAAVIINSSVCLGAAAYTTPGSGSNDPNHPAVPTPGGAGGQPYTGRGCRTAYGCKPPAGSQP